MTDFTPFLKAYGKPVESEPATKQTLAAYSGVLPDQLFEFWEHYGFGAYGKGLVWVVDPTPLEDELAKWVRRPDGRAVPVVRTAFGDLVYWHKSEYTFLDVHQDEPLEAGDSTEVLFDYFLIAKPARRTLLKESLFKRAYKKLGALKRDEMYAFGLPLAMGGDDDIKNVVKVKMREQLAILRSIHRE